MLGAQTSDGDPPSRVARVSYLSGSVSFRPATVDDWATASLNYPLTTGDHLWADQGSRAELQIGSTDVRLGDETAFAVLALDDHTAQFQMTQGAVDVTVRTLGDADAYEIDTPNGAVTLLSAGTYRVDVDTTGASTTVTVRHGAAEVTASGSTFPVRAGQSAVVAGLDSPTYDVSEAAPPDEWERWCALRDGRQDAAVSARYVSPEMIGYEDLDAYGRWHVAAGYGPVWTPTRVALGWVPYRDGHWAWVEPWGWTWIDDAPWGFAPFHYGRWAFIDGGWAWAPGQRIARPVYAPALVAFVGGGSGVHVSIGIGSQVAWFPLAPGEPYYPAYRTSRVYVQNVNVTTVHVTNINVTNIHYANRGVRGGVIVVPRDVFASARPVGRSVVHVDYRTYANAPVVRVASVAPRRESVLGRPIVVGVHRPPTMVDHRRVVVRRAPPPAAIPFSAREAALAKRPGRPLDGATLAQLRGSRPARGSAGNGTPARRAPGRGFRPATAEEHGALRPARAGLPPASQASERPMARDASHPEREGVRPPIEREPARPSMRPLTRPDAPSDHPTPPERVQSERPLARPAAGTLPARPAESAAPPREPPARVRPEPRPAPVQVTMPPNRGDRVQPNAGAPSAPAAGEEPRAHPDRTPRAGGTNGAQPRRDSDSSRESPSRGDQPGRRVAPVERDRHGGSDHPSRSNER